MNSMYIREMYGPKVLASSWRTAANASPGVTQRALLKMSWPGSISAFWTNSSECVRKSIREPFSFSFSHDSLPAKHKQNYTYKEAKLHCMTIWRGSFLQTVVSQKQDVLHETILMWQWTIWTDLREVIETQEIRLKSYHSTKEIQLHLGGNVLSGTEFK
jgi:hypothetical protein